MKPTGMFGEMGWDEEASKVGDFDGRLGGDG